MSLFSHRHVQVIITIDVFDVPVFCLVNMLRSLYGYAIKYEPAIYLNSNCST